VIFAGDRVYALDANNGLVAFRLEPPLSITPSGGGMVLAWPVSTSGYTLQTTPSLTPPATWTNVSTGTIVGLQCLILSASSPTSRLPLRADPRKPFALGELSLPLADPPSPRQPQLSSCRLSCVL